MTTLHPEFYQKLLTAYEEMENDQHEPQLTPLDIEKYETLVGQRHLLQLALQGEIGKSVRAASAGRSRRNGVGKIEQELQRINRELQQTLSNCMPDFHAVHDGWFGRYQARELYRADCAYGSRLRPFAIFLAAFMVIGILSLLAMWP